MIKISISVHNLVDFVLRTGDIDNRVFNQETMREGSNIHRSYQNKQGSNYISEYYLNHEFVFKDYDIILKGYVDGIIDEEIPTIEEIKSTNIDLETFFKNNESWHLGQAEVYAYIYCLKNDLNNIEINLVYISQVNKDIIKKNYKYTKKELEINFFKYLDIYCNFLDVLNNYQDLKYVSLENLSFPFLTYRKGQTEIIDIVNDTLKEEDTSFVEASTGIGKTMSFIYSSLKNVNEKKIEKIFYLTAKNSGALAVIEGLNILYKQEFLNLKTVQLIAKEKICLNKSDCRNCNPDNCPFTVGYYNHLNKVIEDSLHKYNLFDTNTILEIAKENQMCPFELSLDISNYCDFIICDYNYVFDPNVYLKRYFDNSGFSSDSRKIMLVDEAHNLISRGRLMYSGELDLKDIKKAIKENRENEDRKLNKLLRKIKKDIEELISPEEDEKLFDYLDASFLNNLEYYTLNFLNYKKTNPNKKTIDNDNLSLSIRSFLSAYTYYNTNDFKIMISKEDKNIKLSINCLNASKFLNKTNELFNGSVYFSGTLSPEKYFKKMILDDEELPYHHITSSFLNTNLKILVDDNISLKYKDRNQTINLVLDDIYKFVSSKVGNYLVFLPSFEYLKMVKEKIELRENAFISYFQERVMKEERRNEFINRFVNEPTISNVGFCVLGGIFSEGIDLKDNRLTGVVIVGVGYPTVSLDTNLLMNYYEKMEMYKGFEYAYVNPGINKIMQAVGRLIRDEKDRGIALLIDSRYKQRNYSFLFKKLWKNTKFIKSNDILDEVSSFYK